MKLTSSKPKKTNTTAKPVEATKPAAPRPAKQRAPKKKKGHGGVIAVVVILVVIIVAAAAGMMYVNGQETIYPNVFVGGVPLAGMTEAEAEAALRDAGYEAGALSVRAEISLPNDTTLVITGEEAGMKLDASEAAARAFSVGRNEGIINACMTFFKGKLGTKNELDAGDIGVPDEDIIRAKAQPLVAAINDDLKGSTFEMTATTIELYKGAGGVLASVDDVCLLTSEMLMQSLRDKTPVTAEYVLPEDPGDGGVDFNALHSSIFKEPVSAAYDPETFDVSESVVGVSFDIESARAAYAAADSGELVVVPLIFTEPEVSADSLTGLLFRDVLSENKTYIDGSSNRINNVKLAASFVNGKVLNPGETFSYNETVGKRTTEKGFLSAGAYVGGRTVQEIGGGICQVSSALYDCTLYAELEVVERRNHQFTVAYLPLGNDATVNWGTTDYKFKNNTDYPIRIETETDGRYMITRLVGTKTTTHTVKIEYTVTGTTPFTTTEVEDASIAPGTSKVDTNGSNGISVSTYRYRYDENGDLIDKEYIARSSYNPHHKIILVPVGTLSSPDPNATPSPTETGNPNDDPTAPPTDGGGSAEIPPDEHVPTPTPDVTPTPDDTPTPTPTPDTTPDETAPAATPNDDA